MSALALKRAAMIAKNMEVLKALNVRPMAPAVKPALPGENGELVVTTPKKRKISTPRTPKSDASMGSPGSRSSPRIRAALDRANGIELEDEDLEELGSDEDEDHGIGGKRKRAGEPTGSPHRLSGPRPNPKIFGHQRGTQVGTTFEYRMGASQAGLHAPVVAGIAGSEHVGAWSVALSGGYEDDIDVGYAFTFTGSGGRDLKGTASAPKNLRTAPQSSDQTFTALNAALKKSVETGKPVRVLRGFKGKSCFAPTQGYRYDGLYIITSYWQDVGESGFKVCKYSFVRMDGQPDIPVQAGREAEAAALIAEYGKGSTAQPPSSPTKSALTTPTRSAPSTPIATGRSSARKVIGGSPLKM